MNSALKHTIIAMATAALGMATTGCKDDGGAEEAAAEATAGAEVAVEAAEVAEDAAEKAKDAAEAKCGEGSCG